MRVRRPWFLERAPDLPDVRYIFDVDDPQRLAELIPLLHRVHTLGLGIDAAYVTACASVIDARELPIRLAPTRTTGAMARTPHANGGITLRVAEPGGVRSAAAQLGEYFDRTESLWREALKKRRRAGVKPEVSIGRPADTGFERRPYRLADFDHHLRRGNFWTGADYQVMAFRLETSSGVAPEAVSCAEVTAMMRHALHKLFGPYARRSEAWRTFIEGPICGHGADLNLRIAFATLPSWMGPHPDGRLRRALVIIPESVAGRFPEHVSELMFRLGSGLELMQKPSSSSESEVRSPFGFLTPDEERRWSAAYAGRSAVWTTLTPVVLHGHDKKRSGRISRAKIEKMLSSAFRQVDIERFVSEYEVSRTSFLPGLPPAQRYFRPAKVAGSGHATYHVRLKFKCPMSGPLLLGLGRHRGLGIFVCRN
jgi:CRISPR-associated protein Csb2